MTTDVGMETAYVTETNFSVDTTDAQPDNHENNVDNTATHNEEMNNGKEELQDVQDEDLTSRTEDPVTEVNEEPIEEPNVVIEVNENDNDTYGGVENEPEVKEEKKRK